MADKIVKTEEQWRQELTPQQFHVLREKGTEPPRSGASDKNPRPGIYHCAGCGEELFDADHKFDSGSGWPSFWQPTQAGQVAEIADNKLFLKRTEVVCSRCDGHLGHVFSDGPRPTGLRYCINGVALTFTEAKD